MTFTIGHKIEALLNGGTWAANAVDVTAYVDQDAGLQYSYGRTDWTQAEPAPGVLTLTFDNRAGIFTPGNTTSTGGTYTVGCRPGVAVRWTTGAATGANAIVRYFEMGVPELVFNGDSGGGGSTVVVACTDSLATLAAQPLQSMLVEHVLAANPVGYYPLTESGTGTLGASDISGNGQPTMIPGTDPLNSMQWGGAKGPQLDGKGALQLRSADAITTPGGTIDGGPLVLGVANKQQGLPDGDTGGFGPLGIPAGTPTNFVANWAAGQTPYPPVCAVSFWFSINDIYAAYAPGTTGGPFVSLLHLDCNGGSPLWYWGIDIVWCTRSRRIMLFPNSDTGIDMSPDSYSVSPTSVHHLLLTIRTDAAKNFTVQGTLDGNLLTGATKVISAGMWSPTNFPVKSFNCGILERVYVGGVLSSTNNYLRGDPAAHGAANTVYALSGGVSHLSVHGPPEVAITASSAASSPAFMVNSSFASDAWRIGQVGLSELADARVARLATYNKDPSVAIVGDFPGMCGTPNGYKLGTQTTEGQSLLSALCTALRAEDATVAAVGVYNGSTWIDTVVAKMSSTLRQPTPLTAIDVGADCSGAPSMAFDTSGAVTTVTATGAGITATYVDASGVWPARTATVDSSLALSNELASLAQFRAHQGRPTRVFPSKFTVDLKTAKGNSTLAGLILGVVPLGGTLVGATIKLTSLPVGVLGVGYTSALVTVVGVQETYDLDRSAFTVTVMPYGLDDYFNVSGNTAGMFSPKPALTFGGAFTTSIGTGVFAAPLATGTTWDYISDYDSTLGLALTTNAGSYPVYMQFNEPAPGEIIKINGVPSSSGVRAGNIDRWQTVTVTRAQFGTTAVAHQTTSPSQGLVIVDSTTGLPVGDPYLSF